MSSAARCSWAGQYPDWYSWQDAKAKRRRSTSAPGSGAVRVRPTGLAESPTEKRYQYHESGCRPHASTCSEWASAGSATTSPEATMSSKAPSAARRQAERERLGGRAGRHGGEVGHRVGREIAGAVEGRVVLAGPTAAAARGD